jgi:adenine-specific DNA-methyltransferase
LLILKGCLIFITPDRFITNIDYKHIRKYLLENTYLKEITSLGDDIFENVAMPSAIIHTENLNQKNEFIKCRCYLSSDFSLKKQNDFLGYENFIFKIFGNSLEDLLLKTISEKSDKLIDHLINGRGVEIGKNSKAIESNFRAGLKKFLRGKDIFRYLIKSSVFIDTSYSEINYKDDSLYQSTKILIRKTGSGIIAVIDDEYRYVIQTIYIFKRKSSSSLSERYILGCLNSKLMGFWYNYTFGEKDRKTFPHLTQGKVLALPILNVNNKKQNLIISQVDKILNTKKANPETDTGYEEKQIDIMVYKLYKLTYEEVKLVDPEFWLSKEEYENYEIKE